MTRLSRRSGALAVIVALAAVITACGAGGAPQSSGDDLLAAIQESGKLRVATDPNYPPQSYLNPDTGQWEGFDVDVAREIAERLGVELEFITPAWDLIVAGSWQDRWDLSVGSMTITEERMQVLYFTQPYYTTPAQVFVHKDAAYGSLEELSGKRVGVCGGCTYDAYLHGQLTIPGVELEFKLQDVEVRTYDTDLYALEDLALGDGVRLDAVLTALPTGAEAIKSGMPLKPLGDPVYFEYLAAAVDKGAAKDPRSLVDRISQIIREMHEDGTLKELSMKYYGMDLASPAADYQVPEQD